MPILIINKHLINAASMAADIASTVEDLGEVPGFCVHLIWSGGTGTVSVQGSNDGTNFVTVASDATGGSAGQFLLNIERCHYRYVKVIYTRASGSGTLDCYLSGKAVS
jgi:hypothetical protein